MKLLPKVTLLLTCLLILSLVQRANSQSRSGAQNHGSSFYEGHSNMRQKKCINSKGVITCSYQQGGSEWTDFFKLTGGIALIAFMLCKCAQLKIKADVQKRIQIIDSVMNQFESRTLTTPSSLASKEKDKLIDKFMKKAYTMVVNAKADPQVIFCQIKVTDLKKENENKYSIRMKGIDRDGQSQFEGLLMFKGKELSLKLSKLYVDRLRARENQDFDILLYEGTGTPDEITGQWAYREHQKSFMYSGTWSMMSK